MRGIRRIVIIASAALLMAAAALSQDAVHVTQAEAIKNAKEKVEPEYPAMADVADKIVQRLTEDIKKARAAEPSREPVSGH